MKRVFTASEAQRAHEREPRDFDLLWKATSQVRPHSPVRTMSGTYMHSAILSRRGDMVVMRPYVIPKDPKTAGQLRKSENMRVAYPGHDKLSAHLTITIRELIPESKYVRRNKSSSPRLAGGALNY